MSRLNWDAVGERFYEMGVDRGVLYVNDQGFAWPGLISVSESPSGGEATPYYIDGFKYLNIAAAEEFEATLSAFYSPPEFGPCDGVADVQNGLFATQQPRKPFSFSYRTKLGNDIDGVDHAYKIHVVYNALAGPAERANVTLSESIEAPALSWDLTTLPPSITRMKPTAHFVIDSRQTPKRLLGNIEDILYGNEINLSRLPTVSELLSLFVNFLLIRIVSTGTDIYELYESDAESSNAYVQSTAPIATDEPILWLDTSDGDYSVPKLITGD